MLESEGKKRLSAILEAEKGGDSNFFLPPFVRPSPTEMGGGICSQKGEGRQAGRQEDARFKPPWAEKRDGKKGGDGGGYAFQEEESFKRERRDFFLGLIWQEHRKCACSLRNPFQLKIRVGVFENFPLSCLPPKNHSNLLIDVCSTALRHSR